MSNSSYFNITYKCLLFSNNEVHDNNECRYVAGTTASAFIVTLLHLGVMAARRLNAQDTAIEDAKIGIAWLAFTMIVDQVLVVSLILTNNISPTTLFSDSHMYAMNQ